MFSEVCSATRSTSIRGRENLFGFSDRDLELKKDGFRRDFPKHFEVQHLRFSASIDVNWLLEIVKFIEDPTIDRTSNHIEPKNKAMYRYLDISSGNQTWLAGKWTIEICDFPIAINRQLSSGFSS